MADFNSLQELLNTTEGMTAIRSNSKNDSSSDTISDSGVPWFKFNGSAISKIQVNGDSLTYFNGSTSYGIKVCNRDGASHYVYSQEGTIKGKISFIKIRWEGYTYYSSTSSNYALKYELFLFSDNRMFLNVIQSPTSSSYLGSSQVVCGTSTQGFTIGVNGSKTAYHIFEPTDADCKVWKVTSGSMLDLSEKIYLLRSGGTIYKVDGTPLNIQELTSETFLTYGSYNLLDLNNNFINENDVDILWWTDSDTPSPPSLCANVTQDIITLRTCFDLSNERYVGINKVKLISIGNFNVRYSPDNVTWSDNYTDEDFMELDFNQIWQACSETKKLYIEVDLLDDTSDLTSILLYPILN